MTNHLLLLDDQSSDAETNTFPLPAWFIASGNLTRLPG